MSVTLVRGIVKGMTTGAKRTRLVIDIEQTRVSREAALKLIDEGVHIEGPFDVELDDDKPKADPNQISIPGTDDEDDDPEL